MLIDLALDAGLLQQLLESPQEVFQRFSLTEEEQELLSHPDHRLLRLLGTALSHERAGLASPEMAPAASQPQTVVSSATLPGVTLVLTLVPCAQYENDRLQKVNYAVWVNPLPSGAAPEAIPPPPGAVYPGEPLTPLHAVIQVSPVQMQDPNGKPLIGVSAAFRKSSNMTVPPPPESAARSQGSPFGTDVQSAEVQSAVAAVRSAPRGERYDRIIDLLHTLHPGSKL